MCGIAGFVNLDGAPADASVLGAMTDMIRHRGADDRGTLCLSLRGGIPDTALGFHRLKIVDLSARGHQPMTSPDGSTALLFQVEPIDPLTYGVVVVGLLLAAAVASYLPARRITRIEPVEALRAE